MVRRFSNKINSRKEGIFMFKVLQIIRYLNLTTDDKKGVAVCYDKVTQIQKDNFENGIRCYEGRVNFSFRMILYDKYVYALNARDGKGIAMFDYLMTNGSFKNKRATSFKI